MPNVLKRDFRASAPNQKWATDVIEFNVNRHKLYLSACMDLYNGEIVAYRVARRPVFELVSSTLEAALARTKYADELIVHSVALQDAAVPGNARETWSQAEHEPQGKLL